MLLQSSLAFFLLLLSLAAWFLNPIDYFSLFGERERLEVAGLGRMVIPLTG
jgi:hypothetical protein